MRNFYNRNNHKDQGGHPKHDQNGHSNQDGLEITKNVPKKWVINLSSILPHTGTRVTSCHMVQTLLWPPKTTLQGAYHNHWISMSKFGWHYSGGIVEQMFIGFQDIHTIWNPTWLQMRCWQSNSQKLIKNQMILTTDKGMALVVMDRKEYIRKARDLLDDTNTYRSIQSDPTNKLKNKLINILKKIKADTGMQENIYRRMYPTGASSPKFYGLPKYTRRTSPWGP